MSTSEFKTRKRLWLTIIAAVVLFTIIYLINSVVATPLKKAHDGSIAFTGDEWLVYAQDVYGTSPEHKYWESTVYRPSTKEVVLEGYMQPRQVDTNFSDPQLIFLLDEYTGGIAEDDAFNYELNTGMSLYANVRNELVTIPMPEDFTGQPHFSVSPDRQFIHMYSRPDRQKWYLNLLTGEWSNAHIQSLPQDIQDALANNEEYLYSSGFEWVAEAEHVLQMRVSKNVDGTLADIGDEGKQLELYYFDVAAGEAITSEQLQAMTAGVEDEPYELEFICSYQEQSMLYNMLFNLGGLSCGPDYNERYDIRVERSLIGRQRVSLVDNEIHTETLVAQWFSFLYPQHVEALFLREDGLMLIRVDEQLYIADPATGVIEEFVDIYSGSSNQIPLLTTIPPADIPFLAQ